MKIRQTDIATLAVPTPFGAALHITANHNSILSADFRNARAQPQGRTAHTLLREAAAQVRAYFSGKLQAFDLPLTLEGTPLQCEVWRAVSHLRFAHFVSYAEVARAVGHPRSHRGVAAAMGKAPIDLFIPAHRVLGADGQLKGCDPRSIRAKLAAFEGYK